MGYPNVDEAIEELRFAREMNPGKWIKHSENVAKAAAIIAERLPGMDKEKAYVLGLLHDIGRRYGVMSSRHMIEGYAYCMEKGWYEVAQICITHSFMIQDASTDIGKWDVSKSEYEFVCKYVRECSYDDYDKLIQLCDSLATDEGICLLEVRFVDVTRRYGVSENTVPRWNAVFDIKEEIENKIGCSIYDILPVKI